MHHITSPQEYANITSQRRPIVVELVTSTCPPCKQFAPRMSAIAQQYPRITFLVVDITYLSTIGEIENVSAVPAFRFYFDGLPQSHLAIMGIDESRIIAICEEFTRMLS